MTEAISRKEVLDLLARGKIDMDEAVDMLEKIGKTSSKGESSDPVFKADISAENSGRIEAIKVEEEMDPLPVTKDIMVETENQSDSPETKSINSPRWLRIRVNNLDTGKNKVAVNIPFGMVKFGLGIARRFNPDIEGVDLDEISKDMSKAEPGVLVEVEDAESNEQVRIFFE